jgi:hypothetical protein
MVMTKSPYLVYWLFQKTEMMLVFMCSIGFSRRVKTAARSEHTTEQLAGAVRFMSQLLGSIRQGRVWYTDRHSSD